MQNHIDCPICKEHEYLFKNNPSAYRPEDHYSCELVYKIFKIIPSYYDEPDVSKVYKAIDEFVKTKLQQRE